MGTKQLPDQVPDIVEENIVKKSNEWISAKYKSSFSLKGARGDLLTSFFTISGLGIGVFELCSVLLFAILFSFQ